MVAIVKTVVLFLPIIVMAPLMLTNVSRWPIYSQKYKLTVCVEVLLCLASGIAIVTLSSILSTRLEGANA